MNIRPLLSLLLLLLAGCKTLSTEQRPGHGVSQLKHLFVEHRLNDNHGLDLLIVKELQALGRDVTSGPLTMLPENADGIITYEDDWIFDFSTHMSSLDLTVRAPNTDKKIAGGRYLNRWVTRTPPEKIVHEVVTALFK